MARMRLSVVSASKAAAAGVMCDRDSVTRSLYVLDEGNRRARIDAAERTIIFLFRAALARFPIAAPRHCGFENRAFNQLTLRDCGLHNRAHVNFTAALGFQFFPRGIRFSQGDAGKVMSAYRASTKAPLGRLTKTRERSRGSYFTRSLPCVRPTSAV